MRLTPDQRCAAIKEAAMIIGNRDGLTFITYDAVAAMCRYETSRRTVRHYFPTKNQLWSAAISHPDANTRLKYEARAIGLSK